MTTKKKNKRSYQGRSKVGLGSSPSKYELIEFLETRMSQITNTSDPFARIRYQELKRMCDYWQSKG